jgi:ABC-type spermidine/putrescine transport system permease subunit II
VNPLADQPWLFGGFAARAAMTAYAGAVFLFLIAPLAVAVILSFSGGSVLTLPPPSWSLRWFFEAYRNDHFREGFVNSVAIAAAAAAIGAISGTAAAIAINHYRFPLRPAVQALLLVPISLPGIALGLGILFALPNYNLAPGNAATILGHSVLAIPYVCTMVLATLANYDVSLELASTNLGATRLETFRRITLPLVLPGTLGGALVGFLISFDNVSISLLTSGGNTLPLQLMQQIQFVADPSVAAVATMLIGLSLTVAVVLGLVLKGRSNV